MSAVHLNGSSVWLIYWPHFLGQMLRTGFSLLLCFVLWILPHCVSHVYPWIWCLLISFLVLICASLGYVSVFRSWQIELFASKGSAWVCVSLNCGRHQNCYLAGSRPAVLSQKRPNLYQFLQGHRFYTDDPTVGSLLPGCGILWPSKSDGQNLFEKGGLRYTGSESHRALVAVASTLYYIQKLMQLLQQWCNMANVRYPDGFQCQPHIEWITVM